MSPGHIYGGIMWELSEITFSIKLTFYGKNEKNDGKVLFIVRNGVEIMSKKLLKRFLFCFVFNEYFQIKLFKLYFEE